MCLRIHEWRPILYRNFSARRKRFGCRISYEWSVRLRSLGRNFVLERTGASLRYIYKGSSAIDRTTVFVAVFTSATLCVISYHRLPER